MKLSAALLIGLVALGSPGVASAQGGEKDKDIPPSSRPPAGMCRIWLDNVPAAQQPAPTDCASAVRNRPAKGRVIFGDDYVTTKKKPDSSARTKAPPTGSKTGGQAIKGFAPSKTSKKPIFP
jgi:hypothetical protein